MTMSYKKNNCYSSSSSPCMAVSSLSVLSFFCFFATLTAATRVGDRHHGNTESGLFYIFGSDITIIDPESGDIVNTLAGSEDWGDTVYMRDLAEVHHYVFANDRESNDLWVIDTDAQELLSRVDTGDRPVHLYAIPSREEIWTHPDTNGTFDILHLGDLNYLSHSNLKVHDKMPGHGKLLWDPNLQDQAFSTNTNEPYIYEINLEERSMENIVNMTLEGLEDNYQCNRTHGIAYSYVNNHLYVECSNPSNCEEENYGDGSICTGSTWEVDVETLTPVDRITSPALKSLYDDDLFGAWGQIYVTPDERFAVVANKNQNYVHVLKPVEGDYTLIIDIPVEYSPGKVVFWPKDNNDVWGPESVVSDYWAVIAQEAEEEDGGIVMIDLELAMEALEAGESGEDIGYVQIVVGTGSRYRPIARGSKYAVTPTGASEDGYTGVAVIDLEKQEVVHILNIAGTGRLQWVPNHEDEKLADHEIRISALKETTDDVEVMAEAALSLACIGFIVAMVAVCISLRNAKHAKAVSGGQYKSLPCF